MGLGWQGSGLLKVTPGEGVTDSPLVPSHRHGEGEEHEDSESGSEAGQRSYEERYGHSLNCGASGGRKASAWGPRHLREAREVTEAGALVRARTVTTPCRHDETGAPAETSTTSPAAERARRPTRLRDTRACGRATASPSGRPLRSTSDLARR